MAVKVKDGGIIKTPKECKIKVNGEWKISKEIYVKQDGVWKTAWARITTLRSTEDGKVINVEVKGAVNNWQHAIITKVHFRSYDSKGKLYNQEKHENLEFGASSFPYSFTSYNTNGGIIASIKLLIIEGAVQFTFALDTYTKDISALEVDFEDIYIITT